MGGEDSKTRESENDYFLLEHLSKMSLKNRKTISYYLISSKKTSFNQLLAQLRQYFKVDIFPSVTTLKQQMSFVHRFEIVKIILTESLSPEDMKYLQQQPRITQIINYGLSSPGQKIAGNVSTPQDLIKLLNSLQEKDALQIPPNNILFLIDQDTKTLNKYRLSYHCNTEYQNRQTAKDDFIKLARQMFPEQIALINQFENQYDLNLQGEEKRKMVLNWAFKDSFYWELVSKLTHSTTDPKRLAYTRLALKDIYQSVAEQYRVNKIQDRFYIIMDLNQQQKSKLQKAGQTFMLFTSFAKGMFNQKQANAELKRRPSAFQFTVNMYFHEKQDKLDFGYVRGQGPFDALLNIYNVFRVEDANIKTRKVELTYGVLPIMDKKRQDQEFRLAMTKTELDLTRNYDFLEDLMSKVDGQATLLQMSGYYKDSLEVYDKKVDFVRKSSQSEETINRCLIRKADALALSGQFEMAEKQYRLVNAESKKMKVIALIHLADMFMRLGQDAKVDQAINQLEPLLPAIENDEKQRDEYFKGKHFLAIKAFKKGSYAKAETLLQKLITNVSGTYTYSLEGKPLVHDIYRTMAAVQSKLGRYGDALKTLSNTLSLQLACEGKTHNVALTQTLIQSVCRTSGNKQELSKSQQRLQSMSTEIDSNQGRLSSSAAMNLNESMINVLM